MLQNGSIRRPDYLRISITDRCNLRCSYCMPQGGIVHRPHDEILAFEEIIRLTRIFAALGVKKIRLTGGEPLVRKNIANLVASLNKIDGIEDISLTTNGSLLTDCAGQLKEAGLKRINISLDTLREDRYRRITATGFLSDVLRGIDKAKNLNFYPLKLNVVVMKGINDDEMIDFIEFAKNKKIILRFIEFMNITPMWREEYFMPIEDVINICEERYNLNKIGHIGSGPAIYYGIEGDGLIGFIKKGAATCAACRRLRLTSTGELKVCLYEPAGLGLKMLLRTGAGDSKIREIINKRIKAKGEVDYRNWEAQKIYMYDIGG